MNFYFTSLGCRLNQAEIESLARRAEALGHHVVTFVSEADWAIINTCTVTHVAARKSRQAIRRLYRTNPNLKVAVTGCYADMSSQEAKSLAGVQLVVPNHDKDHLLDQLLTHLGETVSRESDHATEPPPGGRTRAFIKIQEGCDNRCAYCIVTMARGPSRSRLPDEVTADIRQRLNEGAREIVLSGVNIGAYGQDRRGNGPLSPEAGWNLARLVHHILDTTDVPRLRLSSIEPWDLTPELLALWPNPRLCRQLHLPLQSGSDPVLQRMARRISTDEYRNLLQDVRARVPEMSLSTDLIVGFPGETSADFESTLDMAQEMAFSRLHVFRYSPREGTAAAQMDAVVPPQVAQERSEQLILLGDTLAIEYHQRFAEQTVEVLFETAVSIDGRPGWSGLTDNYLRVWVPASKDLSNRLRPVRCLAADSEGLHGELL